MTVNLAGVVAVCYCGMVSTENMCQSSLHWIFAGLMTIQGPQGGIVWNLPTNVAPSHTQELRERHAQVVKFDLKGWGFSATGTSSYSCRLHTWQVRTIGYASSPRMRNAPAWAHRLRGTRAVGIPA